MTSLLFFLLLAAFVVAAMRAARKSAISPDSQPGRVVEWKSGTADEAVERINIDALICTCPDWQRRRVRFAEGTPMRLCKHLTAHFARHLDTLPQSLHSMMRMIALVHMEKQGMPCGVGTEYGHLDGQAYVIYVVSEPTPMARLILGGRRHELRLTDGSWYPAPPVQTDYFSLRARQLANTAFGK